MRTRHLQLVTREHSVTTTRTSSVYSPYGPVRAGLITYQPTNAQVLEELLNSLEKEVANLNYKSFTVLDTLAIAIQGVRAALSFTPINEAGTDDKE